MCALSTSWPALFCVRIGLCRLSSRDALGRSWIGTCAVVFRRSTLTAVPLSPEQAISALRASLSNAADDQGVLVNGINNLTPVDSNSITFPRNVNQVSCSNDLRCTNLV